MVEKQLKAAVCLVSPMMLCSTFFQDFLQDRLGDSDVCASYGARCTKSSRVLGLPHDVMLDIFSRLPARSLGRFRCVCKLWSSLFHDPHFVSLQLIHASKDPATFSSCSILGYGDLILVYSFKINARKVVVCNKFTVPLHFDDIHLTTNSCNGLVAFYGWYYVYVANPCTQEWMALPKPSSHSSDLTYDGAKTRRPFLALGFSGKYKVVRFFYNFLSCRWACEVFTVGIDHSWRLLGEMRYPGTEYKPAYANGYIYWTINADYLNGYYRGTERVLSFDVGKEKFAAVKLPQLHPKPYRAYRHLSMSLLGGSIFLIDSRMHLNNKTYFCTMHLDKKRYLPVMHIHMLKSLDGSTWADSRTIRLKACASPAMDMFPITIKDGKLHLTGPNEKWVRHRLKTGACQMVDLEYLRQGSNSFACAESIVPLEK